MANVTLRIMKLLNGACYVLGLSLIVLGVVLSLPHVINDPDGFPTAGALAVAAPMIIGAGVLFFRGRLLDRLEARHIAAEARGAAEH